MTESGKEMNTNTRCRKPHTRSRAGCLTCRKRRVRCDGGQPICTKCTKSGRACEYGSDLPLRDRRAEWLPGEHQPWTVDTQVALNPGSPMTNSMDPFDCLGLDMSYKSRQLLHYFRYAKGCTDMLSKTTGKDPFSLLSIHPDALRDTLLVAGLHYAWTVGDIHTYESTLLFHKVATIRILNTWLHNINQPGLMTFVRHVSILCFVEGCHGNVAAAETHLKGLVNAVDLLSPSDGSFPNSLSVGEELANRYLIFTHYSFQGFKARIVSSAALQKIFTQENVAEFSDFLSLVYDWREQRIGNLEKRLGAMRMMPFFFAVLPSDAKFYDIDASAMVECLKSLTATILFTSDDNTVYDPSWEWIEGSESRLLYETVKAHFASLSEPQEDDSSETLRLSTSWSSMCVATGLYLHSALGICRRPFINYQTQRKITCAIMSRAQSIPHIYLLCLDQQCSIAFQEASQQLELGSPTQVSILNCELTGVPSTVQFDTIVSPANSYGQLDGGFDDAISLAFSPGDDYMALTRAAQEQLYDEWRGFAPPGTCTIVRIPEAFRQRSMNVWGTKFLALCPTMRVPMDVRWDREIVYDAVWSLLCAIDKHNRTASENDKISRILMTPMATGTGLVTPERWAEQTVLAMKHFREAVENPQKWSAMEWPDIFEVGDDIEDTWNYDDEDNRTPEYQVHGQ
ncbi:Zn(2)-C6 fungal-type domain-containing protein [Fusarium falciforme]|nr:Zn(2)-C6 fungal-type domain-containing protein [Fusarium falciforme]WAO96623.1 Zn(2)-C6 fungal-type domain-containing protein [Fusarium falciforme]